MMKQITTIILSIVLLQENSHAADQPNIQTKPHVWLESLSQEEQRVALVIYQLALTKKVNEVLIVAKNDADKVWGFKILACGHNFAAQVATKNSDQKEALGAIAAALRDGIVGNGHADSRTEKMHTARLMGQKIANSIPDSSANRFKEKYATESNRFNIDFTVAAMMCASDNKPSK